MSIGELFAVAIGLSMDAFAVSVCKGLSMRRMNVRFALLTALFFGGFQAAMPLIGWAIGTNFAAHVTAYAHWVAFVLLTFIGAKMIYEALRPEKNEAECGDQTNIRELFLLAIATSIDALAIGVSFAFLQIDIVPSALLIGTVTFLLSAVGVRVGHKFGDKYMAKAELAGGAILILIGAKTLLENLG